MIAADILDLARERGIMIATAESCTGGMVAAALTDIAGSSDVFERGFVTYTNRAKTELLGVRPETLTAHGAVSEQVAREMADGALARAPVQLAVAITGIAGPGGSEHKPEGRVCFSLAQTGRATVTETVEFGALGRPNVRAAARDHALRLLKDALSHTA
ncbi:CinA family protein [Jhaorihella thermophila]|uniref:Nicotinamide-nucleotide amidase n=1 Tax=Jhaorihella thermophila TaxID=488547 RepID=A0A1H5S471_9RHOB|nr:CinA family protein [Jhaorihella thermophila]SEF44688.1 nicotinamide-nucleotide amidase [Jhaorihella thermophila]